MNWRSTLALFVILLLLAAVVISMASNRKPTVSTPEPASLQTTKIIQNASLEDVSRLELVDLQAGVVLAWDREPPGKWFQQVPTATEVVSGTLSAAASRLLTTTSTEPIPEGKNPLSAYGLDAPTYKIVLATESEGRRIRHALVIGDENPTGDSFYVAKQGDRRVFVALKPGIEGVLSFLQSPPAPAAADGQ